MSDIDRDPPPSEELVAIVSRAGQLGFCTARVATALGMPPGALDVIRQRIDESAGAHRGSLDHRPGSPQGAAGFRVTT